jgi:peptidoglycan/LPS O-acetylase OafA/YrhL
VHVAVLCSAFALLAGHDPRLTSTSDAAIIALSLLVTAGIVLASRRFLELPIIRAGHRATY